MTKRKRANGCARPIRTKRDYEGASAVAEVAALAHEKTVIDKALEAIGAGTNKTWNSAADPVKDIDDAILSVIKKCGYGSLMNVGVLYGATAWAVFFKLKCFELDLAFDELFDVAQEDLLITAHQAHSLAFRARAAYWIGDWERFCAEVLRRRRAAGSPAEQMLSRTIGIEQDSSAGMFRGPVSNLAGAVAHAECRPRVVLDAAHLRAPRISGERVATLERNDPHGQRHRTAVLAEGRERNVRG